MSRCQPIAKCAISELSWFALQLVLERKQSAGVTYQSQRSDYPDLTVDQEAAFTLNDKVKAAIALLQDADLMEKTSHLASFDPTKWDGEPSGLEYSEDIRKTINDIAWWAHTLACNRARQANIRPLRKRHQYPEPTSDQIEAFDIKEQVADSIKILIADGAMDPLWKRVDFEFATLSQDETGEWVSTVEFSNRKSA